jgi:hypothetical protein
MAPTMGRLLPLCASICVVFDFGVFLPARFPVRRAPLLSCLQPLMLPSKLKMQPRPPRLMMMMHMSSRYLLIWRHLVPMVIV